MLWDLFLTFAKMGAITFGGGYAMLPILQREVVEKKHWATNEDLADYYAIGQCTPGIIAVNVATFIGQKTAGNLGGIVATLGVIFPSTVIIMVLAALISNFADIPAVQHAFGGIRVCVCILILDAAAKLGKSAIKDRETFCIFLLVFLLAIFTKITTVWLAVAAGLVGIVLYLLKKSRKEVK